MATVKTITFTTATTNRGTNGKALFETILEQCPEWEILTDLYTATETDYFVRFKMPNCPIVFGFRAYYNVNGNGTSWITNFLWYEHSAGTVTIGDKTYTAIPGPTVSGYIHAANQQFKIHIIKDGDLYQRVIITDPAGNDLSFVSAVIKELCSGEIRYGGNINDINSDVVKDTLLVCDVDSYTTHNAGPICAEATNNGYTRMSPSYVYGVDFIGHFANQALTYFGYASGAPINLPLFSTFVVGGVRFMSYGSNYAIRITEESEV